VKDLSLETEMTSLPNKYLIVLGGPTASGKTATGIALASHFNSEIISADSRQIYKETRIGTAVPSADELAAVPHHFIQYLSLRDYYNASMFEMDVLRKLDELFLSRNVVFMVGGSGLYINAVCNGIDELPTVDQGIRNELASLFENEGLEKLQEMLREMDPVSFERIDLNNHYRVLKALEVTKQTGRPYSEFLGAEKAVRNFQIIRLALDMDREILYDRINKRVELMMEEGLLDEVKGLQDYRSYNAMKTVGYRELFQHLDGKISEAEAVDLIQRNTRKYARKQLTWFRKDNLYPWYHPQDISGMKNYLEAKMDY